MNASRSFTRCGVLDTYLLYMPWRISCALELLDGLEVDRAGVEEEEDGVWTPVEAGVRCFGAIVWAWGVWSELGGERGRNCGGGCTFCVVMLN